MGQQRRKVIVLSAWDWRRSLRTLRSVAKVLHAVLIALGARSDSLMRGAVVRGVPLQGGGPVVLEQLGDTVDDDLASGGGVPLDLTLEESEATRHRGAVAGASSLGVGPQELRLRLPQTHVLIRAADELRIGAVRHGRGLQLRGEILDAAGAHALSDEALSEHARCVIAVGLLALLMLVLVIRAGVEAVIPVILVLGGVTRAGGGLEGVSASVGGVTGGRLRDAD